ncbi:MAG: TonB-dependent receptor [Myxococcota bacterium]
MRRLLLVMALLSSGTAHAQADGGVTAPSVKPPRLVFQPRADFPLQALRGEPARTCTLRVTVDEAGEVARVEVVDTAGEELDWVAMGAVASSEFEPAEVDGVATPVQVDLKQTFTAGAAQVPDAGVPPPVEEVDAGPAWAQTPLPPPFSVQEMASFSGVVVDMQSRQPLGDVEVYVRVSEEEPMVTTTDEQGRFSLSLVPAGSYLVALTATGYEQFSTTETFQAGEQVQATYELRALRATAFETVVRDTIRRVSKVSMVVGSVSRVDEKDLVAMAPQSGNEVLRTVPGVIVVEEEGVGLRPNIAFRGLNPNRSSKILVLEDGAPVSLNPYGRPEAYYTPPIERMAGLEVAKGSDSILHGPQTIGGVLNYITADPPQKLTVISDARLGTYGYWLGHFAIGNTHGPVGYRLDVVHRRFVGPRHLDLQLVDVAGKVRVAWTPAAVSTFKLNVYDEDSAATYLGLTTPLYEANPYASPAIHDRYLIRRYSGAINHDHALNRYVRIQGLLYGNNIDRRWSRQDYDRVDRGTAYERIVTAPGREPDDDGGTLYFKDNLVHRNREYWVAGVEPRLILRIPLRYVESEIISGIRLHYERAREVRQESPLGFRSGEVMDDEDRTGVAVALFAQYRLTLFDTLRITPGLRVENFWARRHILRQRVPAGGTFTGQDVDVANNSYVYGIIPGLGVAYSLLEGLMFYAGVHRGFAPPRSADAISPSGEDLKLEAELSWNLEAGTRLALGDWLRAEGGVFLIDFENQIIAPTESGGATTRRLENSGRSRHTGLEATVTWDLARLTGWKFELPYSISYTLVEARFTAGPYDGNRVPYAPQHVVSSNIRFVHPLGFNMQLTGTYLSPQYTDPENTKVISADGTTGPIGRQLIVDGRVAYTFAPLGLTGYVSGKNLLDQKYIASRVPAGVQPGPPRQFIVGVRGEI